LPSNCEICGKCLKGFDSGHRLHRFSQILAAAKQRVLVVKSKALLVAPLRQGFGGQAGEDLDGAIVGRSVKARSPNWLIQFDAVVNIKYIEYEMWAGGYPKWLRQH
jgi:hypothetical protein